MRIVVAKTPSGNYIPLDILKKESSRGYNITADYDVSNILDRISIDIMKDQYETWDFE
ncbi:hypothetical protein KC711_07220 [Candidatus Peregrinibacteria bacterium]|nr:hypothetical protein [Candidatus Peregrinibacteria bacterium]